MGTNGTATTRVLFAVALVTLFAIVGAACGSDDDSTSSSTPTTASGGSSAGTGSGGNGTNSQSSSASIESLQRELDALGCNAGPLDGTLGPDTLGAIRHFQSAAGLTVDGIVGVNTSAKLSQAAQSGSPNCTSVPAPAPTTTTKPSGNAIQCNVDPIKAGVQASLLPGETIVLSGAFNCAGNYAVNTPTIGTPNGQKNQVTDLFVWNGATWQVVNRAIYCENGSVPQAIYAKTCQNH
jgi:peptidoglycan hydrolase-like protein with peptidoglycan-binding domain